MNWCVGVSLMKVLLLMLWQYRFNEAHKMKHCWFVCNENWEGLTVVSVKGTQVNCELEAPSHCRGHDHQKSDPSRQCTDKETVSVCNC